MMLLRGCPAAKEYSLQARGVAASREFIRLGVKGVKEVLLMR